MSDPFESPYLLDDPLALFEASKRADARAEEKFNQATRELFNTVKGRKWLTMAMARSNFMGSVFSTDDAMNPTTAAHRDGARSFLSDILNAAFDGKTKTTTDPDDDAQ